MGPVAVGFGTVVAAGSVLRRDAAEDGRLVVDAMPRSMNREFTPRTYPNLERIVRHNVRYVGNLVALSQWYAHARRPFLTAAPLGQALYDGALDKLKRARAERIKRLGALADKAAEGAKGGLRRVLGEAKDEFLGLLRDATGDGAGEKERDALLSALTAARSAGTGYIEAIQSLDASAKSAGTAWLDAVVEAVSSAALSALSVSTD